MDGTVPSFATATVAGSVDTAPHTVRSPASARTLVVRMLSPPSAARCTATTLDRSARNSSGNGKHTVSGSFKVYAVNGAWPDCCMPLMS